MDWKSYYRQELESDRAREFIRRCWTRYPQGDERVREILSCGGIISFPHTSIYYAGESLARIITAIYHGGFARVLALGVLHGGTLPERYRRAYEGFQQLSTQTQLDLQAQERSAQLLALIGGAFYPTEIDTPFGPLPLLPPPPPTEAHDLIRADEELLRNEFSLDNFLGLLALYAREADLSPPQVLPLYIGLTRRAPGDFAIATELATALRELLDGKTAMVMTGDLVHYGTAYSVPEELQDRPRDPEKLHEFFLKLVQEALRAACRDDYERFFQLSTQELKNDQRYVLPVACELLNPPLAHEILDFRLSDYSEILQVERPCVVASALIGLFK